MAFSRIVVRAKREIVVVDTAPTGHTLRLLDTAGSNHRQLVPRGPRAGEPRFVTPLMLLRDPTVTKVLIVTLAETTPVLEAQALQEDLRQAGIEPFAWVINASLLAAQATDPVLRQRASAKVPLIRRVAADLAERVALVPFQVDEATGPARLRELAGTASSSGPVDRAPMIGTVPGRRDSKDFVPVARHSTQPLLMYVFNPPLPLRMALPAAIQSTRPGGIIGHVAIPLPSNS